MYAPTLLWTFVIIAVVGLFKAVLYILFSIHFHIFSFPLQALLKLVADCSIVALSPSRRDAVNESPLKIALFSLGKMCAHAPCRLFLRSSEFFPDLARLKQSPDSTIANYASIIINKVSETWSPRVRMQW